MTFMKYQPLTVFLLCLALASVSAQDRRLGIADRPERRVALVIGNGAYEFSRLQNPVNDAREMRRVLVEMGFEVIYKENANQREMKEAIRDFGSRIRDGVGLFYFAGHGAQVNGENYLIPVNAVITNQPEIEYEAVNVGLVLAQMANAANRLNILILDACRNNPFARSFRSETKGLAYINAPSGTLIAYATAPGSVASDGDSGNGLYTEELLKAIREPGLKIEEVFKRARLAVQNRSGGKQVPWESSSLVGDFYFKVTSAGEKKSVSTVERVDTAAMRNMGLLFEDDFVDNRNKWINEENPDNETRSIKISGGRFVFQHKVKGKNYVQWNTANIDTTKDFTIEALITRLSGETLDNGYGVAWGIKDANSYYSLMVAPNGHVGVFGVMENAWFNIKQWAKTGDVNPGNATNKFKIVKIGQSLEFYINDMRVHTCPFQNFFGNRLGFVISGDQKIAVDNIVVNQSYK